MEEERLDRLLVDVAGELVAISPRDRGTLLQELCLVPGCETIRARFEAAGERRPVVELSDEQRSRLRAALETWERDGLPPQSMAALLAALVRAERRTEIDAAAVEE